MTDARALFVECGEALYGPSWQRPLAKGLEVSERSVRYWLAGRHAIPQGVWRDIYKLFRHQADQNKRLSYVVMRRQLYPEDET